MPYRSNNDLPDALRKRLPAHAQSIYREAFNHAWVQYSSEDSARRVAWAAVKRKYKKEDGVWTAKEPGDNQSPVG